MLGLTGLARGYQYRPAPCSRPLLMAAMGRSYAAPSTYVHPLSELILREVRCMRPPWFSEDQVALQKDGTVTISFVCNGQPGVLRTFYDTETRSHYMALRGPGQSEESVVPLFEKKEHAWQERLNTDAAISAIKKFIVSVPAASQ